MNKLPTNKGELDVAVETFKSLRVKKDPQTRIDAIAKYLNQWNIDTVVVGVSGGVDSALVLAMLAKIPNLKIYAVNINFNLYDGVYDERFYYDLETEFEGSENIFFYKLDMSMSEGFDHLRYGLPFDTNIDVDANLSYAMRYLVFFAFAQQFKGITIGTTNYDEMGYVGWFGKSSDMMVDLQPIADLHKFEVVEWARQLGVPESICSRSPVGDLLNDSTDEENFGVTYDELSFFTALRSKTQETNDFLDDYFAKVNDLRAKNAHKYQGQNFNPVFIKG